VVSCSFAGTQDELWGGRTWLGYSVRPAFIPDSSVRSNSPCCQSLQAITPVDLLAVCPVHLLPVSRCKQLRIGRAAQGRIYGFLTNKDAWKVQLLKCVVLYKQSGDVVGAEQSWRLVVRTVLLFGGCQCQWQQATGLASPTDCIWCA
jgi:hypothetical protein